MYIGTMDAYTMLIVVFVDNILVALADDTVMHVMTMFHKKFKIQYKAKFLNIWISLCPGRITINQELYIRAILDKYYV